jgi:hypothetical protein
VTPQAPELSQGVLPRDNLNFWFRDSGHLLVVSLGTFFPLPAHLKARFQPIFRDVSGSPAAFRREADGDFNRASALCVSASPCVPVAISFDQGSRRQPSTVAASDQAILYYHLANQSGV